LASRPGTLETLARQLGLALQPLETQLTPANLLPFLAQLGLQFPPQLLAQSGFMAAVNSAATAAGQLPTLLSKLASDVSAGNDGAIITDGLALVQQIEAVVTGLDAVAGQLNGLSGSLGLNPADVAAFAQNLTSNLLSYLAISYLENVQPGLVAVGDLSGILDYLQNPGVTGDPTHPPYISRHLQLSNLGQLLTDPETLFQTIFDWGSPTFDGTKLVPRLSAALQLLGLPATSSTPGSLDTFLFSLKANPATTPPGLIASLSYAISDGININIPLTPTWSVQATTQGTFAAGISATITPPVTFKLAPPSGTLAGQLQLNLVAASPDSSQPLILVGETGMGLLANSFTIGAGLTVTWDSTSNTASVDPSIQIVVAGGKAVIDMSQADGFLADVLSGVNVQAPFNLTATWRLDTGLHITGGAQLEIDLPLHLSLGPVTLPTLYLIAGASSAGIPLEISAALGLTLGPFEASVDRVGVKALLSFPASGGNLGPADLSIAFKPPNGLGLDIDAGVVAGGGYISFDPDKGQYAGILQVTLADIVQVCVIGVLDTILPDGSKGFSLLLIITFNFPPIQLGFGFTLNGVGGLGGVNRTMNIDALQAGFRAHALNSILFPPDPIENAPQIISNIRNFFPPADGRYLFGPMLEIGWGTPTLITLAVGVILELPDPVRIVILGLIDAGLPSADVALIELHIDVLGVIDFGAKTLSIDGSLYDSHVLIYSLAGDLALCLSWGTNPNFVFSLGGFNPHFNSDGLNVPTMARLSVSIGDGDNPRISANSYYAITSNTVQFGANVEAYAEAGGFSIHGYLGFDVLIIISPFSFEFDFSAGLDVAYDGATLLGLNVNGTFSGPTPWHVHGEASISLLFFSVSASLDLTWGDSTQVTIPAKPVLPDLFAALQDPRNWNAALPASAPVGVTFVARKPDDTTLLVHPMGTLTVREKVMPLDLPITRYGNATPSDGTEFSIAQVQINGNVESVQPVQDYFAAGQFLTLSDADKLSKPSFEDYDAGVAIGSSTVVSGSDSPRTVVYQEHYIEDPLAFSRFSGIYQMPAGIHLALTAQGAGAASKIKNTGLAKFSAGQAQTPIKVSNPGYVVTSVLDLSVRSDVSSSPATFYETQAAMTSFLALHPEEAGNLQIMPLHEVSA
jgi:hypothetical protein